MEAKYQQYKDDGLIVVTMLDSGTPQQWVQMAGLSHPVLGVDTDLINSYIPSTAGTYPSSKLLKPNMVVYAKAVHPASVGATQIEAILP